MSLAVLSKVECAYRLKYWDRAWLQGHFMEAGVQAATADGGGNGGSSYPLALRAAAATHH